MMKGSGYTIEYENHIDETWPIHEVPPSPLLFPGAGSSSRRTLVLMSERLYLLGLYWLSL